MTQVSTRYRHLAELAVAFLEDAGQPQPSQALAGRLFAQPGIAAGPFVRLVEQLLTGDVRFRQEAGGSWSLAGWERAADSLADAGFAVVDVETTGGRTEKHRIVEVAVVVVERGMVTGHYESLVNPLRPLPPFITELTGITQEMVDEAPTAAEVLPELRAIVGDRVLVGHNVGCDLTFLNYESLWHDLPPFGNVALDTEELAMRLLPQLRRPSLSRVAMALGLTPPTRHRALADARLAAAVLLGLLRRLPAATEAAPSTVGQLQDWLASRLAERQARVRRAGSQLAQGTLRSLPEAPGVYTFADANGQALYVGKAGSLRDRVAQHFSGTARALRRHDGLLERTVTIAHEVVGCELDALLLESARIRALRPPYNVQARSRRGCPFLRFEPGPFPRAGATQQIDAGGGDDDAPLRYAGPYRTTQHVRHTLETLRRVFQIRPCRRRLPATRAKLRLPCLRHGQGLCPAPCAAAVTEGQYGVLVEYAWRFVTSGRVATLDALDARLSALEAEGASGTWEYGLLRECRARLRRVRREYRPVEGGRAGDALVMAYRAADGGAVLYFVADGRLGRRVSLPAGAIAGDGLVAAVAEHQDGQADPATRVDTPLDADQVNILMRWIYRRAARPECVVARQETPAAQLADAIRSALIGDAALQGASTIERASFD